MNWHPLIIKAQKNIFNARAAQGDRMDITVTFRHLESTDALRDYAREKVSRIKNTLVHLLM